MLKDKTAIVYGGGGAIGSAAARAFAREGARAHLAGRTRARLEAAARDIETIGGVAEIAELDALDEVGSASTPTRWQPGPGASTSPSTP